MADPSQAQGAQVPLTSFDIPDFPPQARSLKALTLTSEIKVDQYQDALSKSFTVPDSIPYGIESLTLELFSLGFPIGFLSQLARRLPNLKSVIIYSQLFTGLTADSQQDAVEFFKLLPNLRALHLLDVFARPGFFASAARWLTYNTSETAGEARRGLMFLEVNYTFDQEDGYMSKIAASELHKLIGPGLVSCSFNISPPEDEAGTASQNGVMAFSHDVASSMCMALTGEETAPRGLRALNLTLFTITPAQLLATMSSHPHVMIVNVTLQAEPGESLKKSIVEAMRKCKALEQIEVVLHPSVTFFHEVSARGSASCKADMHSVTEKSLTWVRSLLRPARMCWKQAF